MKFTSTKENLHQGINLVAGLATKSVGLPILNNILLDVHNGTLKLAATNLEIGIKTEVRGKAEIDGSFTVNARVLADYVNILPDGNVVLFLKDNQLQVSCENYTTKIRGQQADEFPIIPEIEEKNEISLVSQVLKQALSQTTFATSFDEMRPEINGVLFAFEKEFLKLTATDSYRLSENKIGLNKPPDINRTMIIPLKTLLELERILANTEDKASLFIEENQVMFKIKSTTLISRLIEGNFPDYQQIIPAGFKTRAMVDRLELIQATRAAALFTRTGINDIHLKFSPNGKLEIKTTNAQLGEQQTVLEAEVKGAEVSVVFNYKYFLDGLQASQSAKMALEIDSASAPVVVRGDQEKNFLYLVMPIKQ